MHRGHWKMCVPLRVMAVDGDDARLLVMYVVALVLV